MKNRVIIVAMEEEQKEEIFQSPPEYQSRLTRSGNGSSAKRYLTAIAFVVVIVLIILGIFRFTSGGENSNTDITPTPTEIVFPTEEPTPTEEVTGTPAPTEKPTLTPAPSVDPIDKSSGLDRSKLSVHILNGSGVTGAAKKVSDLLEGLGYNVIQIGNAQTSDYASTELQVVSGKDDFIALLKKDLSGSYTVGKTSDSPPADEKADAVVIVGKE